MHISSETSANALFDLFHVITVYCQWDIAYVVSGATIAQRDGVKFSTYRNKSRVWDVNLYWPISLVLLEHVWTIA